VAAATPPRGAVKIAAVVQVKEYELVRRVQGQHWWWIGRERILEALIEKYVDLSRKLDIADVGCGFGANISMLRKYGDVAGLELDGAAIETVKSRWGDSVQAMSWRSPNPVAMRFNFMLLGDVLEHIPDDKGAIDWIYEHLREYGHALITVPAHQFLWTQMDEVLDHYRRYNRRTLLQLFDDRFEVVYCSYYNMFLFPVKVGFMLFDRLKRLLFPRADKRSYNDVPPPLVNSIFKHILMLEASIIRRSVEPFGVSLVCLVRKKPVPRADRHGSSQ
jgi:SAM-dependent methyltransferase